MPNNKKLRGRVRRSHQQSRMEQNVEQMVLEYCVPKGLCHHGCSDIESVPGIATFLNGYTGRMGVMRVAERMLHASPEMLSPGSEAKNSVYRALISIALTVTSSD